MADQAFAHFKLHESLLKALTKQSLEAATDIQAATLPHSLEGRDLLMSARTGSGKTLAYLLPLLQRMLANDAPNTATRALVLVPTRELARQVFKDCTDMMSFTRLRAGLVTGGEGLKVQSAQLRKNPEVVIATPGRLVEHIERRSIELVDVEFLVLDEADRMLDLGFEEDLLKIADALVEDHSHQTLLCSATLDHAQVGVLAARFLENPETVALTPSSTAEPTIRQQIVLADDHGHKRKLLARLLEHDCDYKQAMVFTNTRDMATELGGFLTYHKLRTAVLHGEMEHEDRKRVMNLFRSGKVDVLVATDVAARGLDIESVDLVINYDMTRKGDDHLHRIGRTGRAGREGLAISFVTSREWNLMAGIERYLKVHFERRTVKGLEGKFKGPSKLKSSGKAASTRKREKPKGPEKTASKSKQRLRDRKNIGKRRAPSANAEKGAENRLGDGFAPLKKPAKD